MQEVQIIIQSAERTFCLQAKHRPACFEIEALVPGEFAVRIKSSAASLESSTDALIKIANGAVLVRHRQGLAFEDGDLELLSQLPRMAAFLGMEDGETKKFNELFYGLFWQSVPLDH